MSTVLQKMRDCCICSSLYSVYHSIRWSHFFVSFSWILIKLFHYNQPKKKRNKKKWGEFCKENDEHQTSPIKMEYWINDASIKKINSFVMMSFSVLFSSTVQDTIFISEFNQCKLCFLFLSNLHSARVHTQTEKNIMINEEWRSFGK